MPAGVRGNVGQCEVDILRSEREFLKKNFISEICDDGAKGIQGLLVGCRA